MRVWAKPLLALVAVCALSWTVASPAGIAPVDEQALAARVVSAPTTTVEPATTTSAPPPPPTATTGTPPTTAAPPTTRAAAAAPKPPPSTAPPVVVRAPVSTLPVTLPPVTPPPPRDLSVYKGLGTWVDAYDFSPEYQPNGSPPTVTPESVDQMVGQGVRTLYLQAAKDDTRSPGELVNPEILGPMLARAHSHGIKVVAWYLAKFYDLDSDMRRLLAMRDFRYDGEGFDGLGLDIEWREDVPNNAERNARLIELSRRLRRAMGDAAISAIPLPPVLTEVINPAYWPDFPWRELAPLYDVWMPMDYWTFRTRSSGYKDGYRYTVENIRRLRANLGLPGAAVHPAGGTDNKSTDEDYRGFVRACAEEHAIGGSIYDWRTTPPQAWGILRAIPD